MGGFTENQHTNHSFGDSQRLAMRDNTRRKQPVLEKEGAPPRSDFVDCGDSFFVFPRLGRKEYPSPSTCFFRGLALARHVRVQWTICVIHGVIWHALPLREVCWAKSALINVIATDAANCFGACAANPPLWSLCEP